MTRSIDRFACVNVNFVGLSIAVAKQLIMMESFFAKTGGLGRIHVCPFYEFNDYYSTIN